MDFDTQRFAVLADIHGNWPALDAVVGDIQERNISTVINLGDHVSGPLWPKETLQYLMSTNWVHILGNHDRQLVECEPAKLGLSDAFAHRQMNAAETAWLAALPPICRVGKDILAMHGSPGSDLEYLLETISNGRTHLSAQVEIIRRLNGAASKLILCGHTHTPRCVTINGSITIVNPGSVGLQAYIDDSPTPHVVEIGSPHARYAVVETSREEIRVEFIALHYDWNRAVERAKVAGRSDWVNALGTGFI